jgi:septal ring factor EnvC (AmiA/AmiB activator)
MSTLSKVFVVLVFFASVFFLGITATLFAQKVDWKDKFGKEVVYHYQTQQEKNAEIAVMKVEIDNVQGNLDILREKLAQKETELAGRSVRLSDAQRELDVKTSLLTKLEANLQVFVRQLEVQLAQYQDMTTKVDQYRKKMVVLQNQSSIAMQELQYARQEQERLSRDLAELEAKHVEVAREKNRLEENIAHLEQSGIRTTIGPRKKLEGRVQAVSSEIGLVVIDLGQEAGVMVGDEFTVYRGSKFVAKIVIEKTDAKWSAGRVEAKRDNPQVADNVSNQILMSGVKFSSGN